MYYLCGMKSMKTINDFKMLSPFDRYEGERRTEIKSYDKQENYRGFKIVRNAYIPNGADGRWEVPTLKYIGIGGVKIGFMTVSKTQCKEAIDRWFNLNHSLNNVNELEIDFNVE